MAESEGDEKEGKGGDRDEADEPDPAVPVLCLEAESRDHTKLVGFIKWHPSGAALLSHRLSHPQSDMEDERQRFPHAWTFACGSDDGSLSVYSFPFLGDAAVLSPPLSLTPPPPPTLLRGHHLPVKGLCWSPHAAYPTHLLSSSYDCTAQLWDTSTATPLANLRGHDGRVLTVAWSPTYPQLVYSAGEDQSVRVWDISCQPDREPPPPSRISQVGCSPY